MGIEIGPYDPCPCGSGKKYKFCCYLKRDESPSSESAYPRSQSARLHEEVADSLLFEKPEDLRLFQKALRLMNNADFNAAIPIFRKVVSSSPKFYSPANNLALCFFATGRIDKAIEVQNESINQSPLPNPFGICNLATFYYIKGDLISSKRFLDMALETDMPSADSVTKACEVLSRFHLHMEILDFICSTEFDEDPNVCFYAGVAAANLGNMETALSELKRVPIGHHKASMAQRYLNCLRDRTKPHTVSGDWPYLVTYEICPPDIILRNTEKEADEWMRRPVMADVCEAMLNEAAGDVDPVIGILSGLKSPNATELLWRIVKGSYGPDQLRLEAVQVLEMNGEIGNNESVEILLDGEKREIAVAHTCLNPEFSFGSDLPPEIEPLYTKAIKAMQRKKPNFAKAGEMFQDVLHKLPAFYPAKYNYAVSLIQRGLMDEAEPVVREIVQAHPEYLFARSTLIQILLTDGRVDEAEELISSLPEIEETHPDAMAMWMCGRAKYYEYLEDFDKAADYVKQAYDLAPHMNAVQSFRERYQ